MDVFGIGKFGSRISGNETNLRSGNGRRRFLLRFLNRGAWTCRIADAAGGGETAPNRSGDPCYRRKLWWAPDRGPRQ